MIINREILERTRTRYRQGEASVGEVVSRLCIEADAFLSQGPFSVMDKAAIPPSGDKHDFMSLRLYYWPNPATPDGLPYVNRDCERNPDYVLYDRVPLGDLCTAVKVLALAYFLTGKEAYGAHARRLIGVWFFDEATRMNPNLNFASYAPGLDLHKDGNGIIGSINFTRLLDAIPFLEGYPEWTAADHRQLQEWFRAYLDWMLTSEPGRIEQKTRNNHGLWYDVQVLCFARFIGEEAFALDYVKSTALPRIGQQIAPDGEMPHETRRPSGLHYTEYNLNALLDLATLAQGLGVDLFGYSTPDGRGIRAALGYALPYFLDPTSWPHQQIGEFQPGKCVPHLYRFARAYKDPTLIAAAKQLKGWEKISAYTLITQCQEA